MKKPPRVEALNQGSIELIVAASFQPGRLRKDTGWISRRAVDLRQREAAPDFRESGRKDGVADGTRTRNNQNHNLGLYH